MFLLPTLVTILLYLSNIMVFANAATIAGAYFTMPESSYLNVHTGSVFNVSWAGAVGLTDIHLEGHGAGDSLFAGDMIIACTCHSFSPRFLPIPSLKNFE